jgi:3'(2'), 5'-bisphosphate nucleotidase
MSIPRPFGVNLDQWLQSAKSIVWDGVEVLLNFYEHRHRLTIEQQADGPVTTADLQVNHQILEALQQIFPPSDFGYLSEEHDKYKQNAAPLPQPWVWVLDPIDGTRDFIEQTGQFTLHLALLYHHEPVLSLVAVPVARKLYSAIRGQGTFAEYRDGQGWTERIPVRVSSRYRVEELKVVIGRNRNYPRFAELLREFPIQQQVWGGGLGFKIVQILEQVGDVYLSISGSSAPKDWDLAAPDLILTEAGGKLTQSDGRSLRYNQGDTNQWGCLLGSNGPCHAYLCRALTEILDGWSGF